MLRLRFSIKKLENYFSDINPSYSNDGELREIISGSILERRNDGSFYFSHRSFHEFLTADHIINTRCNCLNKIKDKKSANSIFTVEILDFLQKSQKPDGIASKVLRWIDETKCTTLSEPLWSYLLKHSSGFQPIDSNISWSQKIYWIQSTTMAPHNFSDTSSKSFTKMKDNNIAVMEYISTCIRYLQGIVPDVKLNETISMIILYKAQMEIEKKPISNIETDNTWVNLVKNNIRALGSSSIRINIGKIISQIEKKTPLQIDSEKIELERRYELSREDISALSLKLFSIGINFNLISELIHNKINDI